jgi:peptidyl-prolyl cis-trans isomerase B (cyclophilin B)
VEILKPLLIAPNPKAIASANLPPGSLGLWGLFDRQMLSVMYRKIRFWFLMPIAIGILFVGGCALQAATDNNVEPPAPPAVSQTQPDENLPRLEGKATVVVMTKGSPITIEVDGSNAPITAGNFVDLVQRSVYDGLMFHRVVRDPEPFVVQGGDPSSKDTSLPTSQLGMGSFVDPDTKLPRYIPLEILPEGQDRPIYGRTLPESGIAEPPKLSHRRGAVAMARSSLPDSASAQFYFALADLPFLDGSYAVFGYVTEGMDVVDQIQAGDRIESAKVTQGLENLKK